jgi:hypothetical protein
VAWRFFAFILSLYGSSADISKAEYTHQVCYVLDCSCVLSLYHCGTFYKRSYVKNKIYKNKTPAQIFVLYLSIPFALHITIFALTNPIHYE